MTTEAPHIPVLLDEVMAAFEAIGEGFFVDCTLGYAGHSEAILRRHPALRHIGIDRDEEAVTFSMQKLSPFKERSRLIRGSFSEVVPRLEEAPIAGLLADFGVSSLQLDKSDRGFGFEAPVLDMRMDRRSTKSAYDVVNGYDAQRLAEIFEKYGELKGAKRLAQAIEKRARQKPFESAKALSDFIAGVLPSRGKNHPATLPFQAIRIEVNDELGEIERLLDAIEARHFEGEIVALITFHSLEDRLIKRRFKRWERACICPPEAMRCNCGKNHALGKALSAKPIVASKAELSRNPRARSAKLRVFRFEKGSVA